MPVLDVFLAVVMVFVVCLSLFVFFSCELVPAKCIDSGKKKKYKSTINLGDLAYLTRTKRSFAGLVHKDLRTVLLS